MTKIKIRQSINKLYGEKSNEYERRYKRHRACAVIATLLLTAVLGIAYYIWQSGQKELTEGRYLSRKEWDEFDRTVNLTAVSSGGYSKDLLLDVDRRRYTEEELDKMYEPFCEELKKIIQKESEHTDGDVSDMNLAESVSGYPFKIRWQTDNSNILTANIGYENYERKLLIPVEIVSREQSEEEQFWEKVYEEIEKRSLKTKTDKYQELPTKVDGQTIVYAERKNTSVFVFLVLGVLAAFLVSMSIDENLIKKAAMRDAQLKRDYPVFISKIALYYAAGLPVKNIWQEMCSRYEQDKKQTKNVKAVYEEMLRCNKKMRDGYSLEEALEMFLNQIGLKEYTVTINVLMQAVNSGGSDIRRLLKERQTEAFDEQKKRAKILGEQAGTKLLIPMFMMLIVVFIIVLVPAFISF